MDQGGGGELDPTLAAAFREAEASLLLNVSEQAGAPESGTEKHGFENVVGVGIAEKITGDGVTGRLAVAVYVVSKAAEGDVDDAALVPRDFQGVPTDVVASGEFRALPFRGRYRPAPGGVSIGHHRITAGTLGCLVGRDSTLYVLSNNHVLAGSNAGAAGDAVLQPGPADGGRDPDDVIAHLSEFVPIEFGGPVNAVDAAIAETSEDLVARASQCFGEIGASPVAPTRGMVVRKCGRTTQQTRGMVTDVNATVRVSYGEAGTATFQNQTLVEGVGGRSFSEGGDSGSLIVEEAGSRPAALLFGGGAAYTIGSPISAVLAALNVSIVT
jgi:hypothetical protein